jgi:hypothetical protein
MHSLEILKEHRWLQKLIGSWAYEGEAEMVPGAPPEKMHGTENVRGIGEIWVQAEGHSHTPDGTPCNMMMTLGYDPAKQRFVGTWLGSMMTHLWVYEGSLDSADRVLTLNSHGPSFVSEGESGDYRDVIEMVSDDHRILTSQALGEDGQWRKFMTAHYRRQNGSVV